MKHCLRLFFLDKIFDQKPMKTYQTEYGTVKIGFTNDIFNAKTEAIQRVVSKTTGICSIGLTGGSTPKAYYQIMAQDKSFSDEALAKILWSASDERYVPTDHPDNNFGVAYRTMLQPLSVSDDQCLPWPTEKEPLEAVKNYQSLLEKKTSKSFYDLCILGMGDDCHTLSLFPQSPLLASESTETFAAVEVPEKGWRLTLTPFGLKKCPQIVQIVTGRGKAAALAKVFHGEYDPFRIPSQIQKNQPNQVTWLIDNEAATDLRL